MTLFFLNLMYIQKILNAANQSLQLKLRFATLALLILASKSNYGQIYEAGIMGGSSFYIGDLRSYMLPDDLFHDNGFAAGGLIRYSHNQHVAARINMLWANIHGSDKESPFEINPGGPDYEFSTSILEFSLQAEINFLPFWPGDDETRFTPFLFGGVGGMYFNMKPNVGQEESGVTRIFLLGMGIKLNVSNNMSAGFEWGMRNAETDNLDYVTGTGMPGNPKNTDWFSFIGLTLTYKFLDRSCPPCPKYSF